MNKQELILVKNIFGNERVLELAKEELRLAMLRISACIDNFDSESSFRSMLKEEVLDELLDLEQILQ